MYTITSILILLAASSQLVSGHGAIIKATGDAGGSGMALGGMFTSFPYTRTTQLT